MAIFLGALVLLKRRRLGELAVGANRNADAASARVVCGQDILARRVNNEMARRVTL